MSLLIICTTDQLSHNNVPCIDSTIKLIAGERDHALSKFKLYYKKKTDMSVEVFEGFVHCSLQTSNVELMKKVPYIVH